MHNEENLYAIISNASNKTVTTMVPMSGKHPIAELYHRLANQFKLDNSTVHANYTIQPK